MNRGDLTDKQWQQLQPLHPLQKPRTGRPAREHRQILKGILWVLRTGAPWRDLPSRYGKLTTVYSRFQRWRKSGSWARVFQKLQTLAHQSGQVDWEVDFVDTTIVRAHQHAAGAKKAARTERL